MVSCFLDNHPVEALWDTGAQSSVINDRWRQQHLPHTTIRPIKELLGEDTLTVHAANNTPIPYLGWTEVNFTLAGEPDTVTELRVPLLVSSDPAVADDPIIGYNVIETVFQQEGGKAALERQELVHKVSKAFAITVSRAQTVMKLMQHSKTQPNTGVVRTGWKRMLVPAKQVITAHVRAHISPQFRGQDVYFSPDVLHPPQEGLVINEVLVRIPDKKRMYVPIPISNTTDHNIVLEPHRIMGHLETVKTVYAPETQAVDKPLEDKSMSNSVETQCSQRRHQQSQVWDPPVNLDHLTNTEQEVAKQMLREECQAFAYDEQDVGYIPSLKMYITLQDTRPVQKTYMSVPKPLHKEVKEYLQDLLNRG